MQNATAQKCRMHHVVHQKVLMTLCFVLFARQAVGKSDLFPNEVWGLTNQDSCLLVLFSNEVSCRELSTHTRRAPVFANMDFSAIGAENIGQPSCYYCTHVQQGQITFVGSSGVEWMLVFRGNASLEHNLKNTSLVSKTCCTDFLLHTWWYSKTRVLPLFGMASVHP